MISRTRCVQFDDGQPPRTRATTQQRRGVISTAGDTYRFGGYRRDNRSCRSRRRMRPTNGGVSFRHGRRCHSPSNRTTAVSPIIFVPRDRRWAAVHTASGTARWIPSAPDADYAGQTDSILGYRWHRRQRTSHTVFADLDEHLSSTPSTISQFLDHHGDGIEERSRCRGFDRTVISQSRLSPAFRSRTVTPQSAILRIPLYNASPEPTTILPRP